MGRKKKSGKGGGANNPQGPNNPGNPSNPKPQTAKQGNSQQPNQQNQQQKQQNQQQQRNQQNQQQKKKPKPKRKPTPRPPYHIELKQHYYHVDQLLDRPGPMTDPSFEAGDTPKDFMRKTSKVLVIGAGGLGCEILQNLALLGFGDIHVIDMDTIDISNLNRQFLFREKDIGQSKAEVAAKFIMHRVPQVKVTPHYSKIEDKDNAFYMMFNLVICGLDSIQARRWINATMVNLVDPENPESLKPLIDGGTEDKKLDSDNPDHMQWLYEQASARAKEHDISGITWSLTQGVVKNIIPAIASTNAIIAASCCNEAFKIATTCAPYLQNYMMYNGGESIYTYTFQHEKKPDCPVCGGESVQISISKEWFLQQLVNHLIERPDFQIKQPSLSTPKGPLFFQGPRELRAATEANLSKKMAELFPDDQPETKDGIEITVTDSSLPFKLSLLVKLQ